MSERLNGRGRNWMIGVCSRRDDMHHDCGETVTRGLDGGV